MEQQVTIQISYVELITEGYVSKLTIREVGNYVFS